MLGREFASSHTKYPAMEIGKQFNALTLKEYYFYIDNHKSYKDFNTLGLYRSIVENDSLSLEEKIAVREYAHNSFKKTFEFLQLKDPQTFIEVSYLGQPLTLVEERNVWKEIQRNQEKILKDKQIKHRNFGEYSKHNCGYDHCPYNGIMVRRGSRLVEQEMRFHTDKDKYEQKLKSARRKADRKNEKIIIRRALDDD
jgi:glutamate synthase domain-containing protein 2